jgi:MFS transporter, SP family, general alpha glucoside:H+ symporter
LLICTYQLWPLPMMIVAYFAPESPWYLVRVDRLEEAKHSIIRLTGSKTEEQMNNQLAMMLHTIKIEAEATAGATYADCFKGDNLRRTEIVCIAFCGQILSGSSFAYTPTYFFTTAGMAVDKAFELGLGAKGMAFVGTVA